VWDEGGGGGCSLNAPGFMKWRELGERGSPLLPVKSTATNIFISSPPCTRVRGKGGAVGFELWGSGFRVRVCCFEF